MNADERSTNVTLHHWTRTGVSLSGALANLGARMSGAVALLYSAGWCRLGVVAGGGAVDAAGKPIDTDGDRVVENDEKWIVVDAGGNRIETGSVFEARIFNADGELRWWNDPDTGTGRAVWLSESDTAPAAQAGEDGWAGPTRRSVWRHPNQYLLWGEHETPLGERWTRLWTLRVGTLDVPSKVPRGERGLVMTFEYMGAVEGEAGDSHGNVAIVEERLVGLGAIAGGAR